MRELQDQTLSSITRLSATYAPAARGELRRRVEGVEGSTRTLRDLTRRIEADNSTVRPLVKERQQPGASSEDHALAELRRLYG